MVFDIIIYWNAKYWYEKSATKKYTKALNNMAYFYQKGIKVDKSIEKAEELLKKYNADGLFVDDSDHVWMTEGMKERFQLLKDTYSISE